MACRFHHDRPALIRGLCSACYQRERKAGTLAQYVYKKGVPAAWLRDFLSTDHNTDECLLWPYGVSHDYGVIYWEGRNHGVHRLVLAHYSGGERVGFEACHSCDNPRCLNPRHLFWGTHLENMTDATKKARMRKKLTPDDVRAIRALGGTMFQREIGAKFGIAQTVVGDILRRDIWKDVH